MKRGRRFSGLAVAGVATTALAWSAVAAPATTTRTYPAGKPPFYRGEAPAGGRVAYLPVQVLPAPDGISETAAVRAALERLAADLTSHLETVLQRPASGPASLPAEGAPGVYLGCALDSAWECDRESREMVLAVTGPSKRWREALPGFLAEQAADLLLLPALTISDHWLRQKSWKGAKEIPLGTDHSQPVPWLTSLDTPVQVLQLTGVLVDAEGRVVRSGGEGMLALRTGFPASAAGLQRVVREDEVEHLRTELRREERPGKPLVREVALETLVRQLTAPGDR